MCSLPIGRHPSLQEAGSSGRLVASDPEGDPLQYKFYLRGPSTSGFWMDQTGWSKNNRWIWRTNPTDVGYSQVLVAVRDGKHAGPSGSDDYDVASYFIVNLVNQPPVITSLGTESDESAAHRRHYQVVEPQPSTLKATRCSTGTG